MYLSLFPRTSEIGHGVSAVDPETIDTITLETKDYLRDYHEGIDHEMDVDPLARCNPEGTLRVRIVARPVWPGPTVEHSSIEMDYIVTQLQVLRRVRITYHLLPAIAK